MTQIYSDVTREDDSRALPDCEVFYAQEGELFGNDPDDAESGIERNAAGWYWWSCFPGCLADGEPDGPYATEQAAINAAQDLE